MAEAKSELALESMEKVFAFFYASGALFSQMFLPVFRECARQNFDECIGILTDDKPDLH